MYILGRGVCVCVCVQRKGGREKEEKGLFYFIYCQCFSSSLKDLGFYHMGVAIAFSEHYKVSSVIFQNA